MRHPLRHAKHELNEFAALIMALAAIIAALAIAAAVIAVIGWPLMVAERDGHLQPWGYWIAVPWWIGLIVARTAAKRRARKRQAQGVSAQVAVPDYRCGDCLDTDHVS
jgi:H+/Cl- antiporter ClcA